jgi:polyhydroxybutyrate depolymerase
MNRFVVPSLLFAAACSGETTSALEPAAADAGNVIDTPAVETPSTDAPVAEDGARPPETAPEIRCSGRRPQPLDAEWKVLSSGIERRFDVHVPRSYDPTKPTPVVLNFHGFTSDKRQQDLLSRMNAKADREGFVVVTPNGSGLQKSWNAGACCGDAKDKNVDDVQFVRDLLDELEGRLCLDRRRIFATGMSNGGFFSHRLGCELGERIAAIAPVAGVLGVGACTPARPFPVMQFHGTGDAIVPFDGSTGLGFRSVKETIDLWRDRNGCTGAPTVTFASGDTKCETWSACSPGGEVVLCTIDGGGHTWPGGLPVPAGGKTTTALSATDAMWTFFQAHPLP